MMSLIDRFNSFAAAFEACVTSDNWESLGEFFTENATYCNVGGPDPLIRGRQEIVEYLKNDVANNDRRFDSRTLQAVTEPLVIGQKLSRRWRCTYTLAGSPDLIVEGEAQYEFNGELIRSLEEKLSPESIESYAAWMEKFGARLPV